MRSLARVAGFVVAPDVWRRLLDEVPSGDASGDATGHLMLPGVRIEADPWMPEGCILPVDEHGRPCLPASRGEGMSVQAIAERIARLLGHEDEEVAP